MTNKYRFYLNGGLVHPLFDNDQAKEFDIYEDQVFFRESFAKGITIYGDQYIPVEAAAVEAEFTMQVQRLVSTDPIVWETFYNGYFTKFDVENFDDSLQRASTIKLNPDDVYRKILEGWDKEINLIDLGLEKETISYKRYPILQLYIRGFHTAKLINYSKGGIWESDQDFRLQPAELVDDGFEQFGEFDNTVPWQGQSGNTIYIFGNTDDLSNLCVGTYEWVANGDIGGAHYRDYEQVDFGANFKIRYITDTGIILLKNLADDTIFQGNDGSGVGNIIVLSNPDDFPGQFVNMVMFECFTRLLCDAESTVLIPTSPVPVDGAVETFGRKRYRTGLTLSPVLFSINYDHTVGDSGYGQISAVPAVQYVGKYYHPSGATKRWPIARSYWHDMSLWLTTVTGAETLMDEVTEVIQMPDAYRLQKVIRALFRKLDINILHESEIDTYSKFLYNDINPLSGVAQGNYFVTAKSNITKPNYSKAATKVPVKPKDLMRSLRLMFFELMFDVLPNKTLRIEHRYFYDQGGTYGLSGLVGLNLTTLSEPHVKKPWEFDMAKYSFDKQQIKGRIRRRWMDEVSDFFEGQEIEILSVQANKEESDDEPVPIITTDLNYVDTNPESVRNEGLFMLECDADNNVMEPLVFNPELQDFVPIQNGNLSFTTLAANFARFYMPARDVVINGEEVTAVAVWRQRMQKVEFKYPNNFDKQRLVRTSLGKGKIEKASHNLSSDKVTLTLKHLTE
jgi:hypothetical protein